MASITFHCPQCRQTLEAEGEMTGTNVDCPSCHQSIRVPRKLVRTGAPQAAHRSAPVFAAAAEVREALYRPEPEKASPVGKLVLVAILAAAAYVAWPYLSVYQLSAAVKDGELSRVALRVDSDVLQASLTRRLRLAVAAIRQESTSRVHPFSEIPPDSLDKVLAATAEHYASAAGVADLLQKQANEAPQSAGADEAWTGSGRMQEIRFAFFTAPSVFVVRTAHSAFTFRLKSGTWKLCDISLDRYAVEHLQPVVPEGLSAAPKP